MKRKTAEVSSEAASSKNCFFAKAGPQGPRRLRFSFFRFTCQTARGSGDPHSPVARRASKKLMHPRTIGCRFTVPVRSFRGAPSRRKRTARRWVVYRLRPDGLSTGNQPTFRTPLHPLTPVLGGLSLGRRNNDLMDAAPHSSHIPGSSLGFGSRDGVATGASSRRQSAELTRLLGRH